MVIVANQEDEEEEKVHLYRRAGHRTRTNVVGGS